MNASDSFSISDSRFYRILHVLNKGTDPNLKDSSGYSALHYAARSGNVSICKALLDSKAFVDAVTSLGGATPLMRGCLQGHLEV